MIFSLPKNSLKVLDKNFEPGSYTLNGPIEIKSLTIGKTVTLEVKSEPIKNVTEDFNIGRDESGVLFNNSKILSDIKIEGDLYILEESFSNSLNDF